MSHTWKHMFVGTALAALLGVPAVFGEDVALREELEALRAEIVRLQAERRTDTTSGDAARFAELERRIDLLAAEIEKARSGDVPEESSLTGRRGLAPAASKVYGVARGVSLGGYGEVVYQRFGNERQDGAGSGRTDEVDYLRQILYVGYKWNDKILFNSEIEFEHGSTGKGGEVSVEFGYVEVLPRPGLGLRAGMLLVPMGFLNELHEPPIFHGARRPEVEQAVIPSTWRENGAGLFGEVGPVQWRAYVVAGLSSAGFGASGIRGGRQSGARSKAEDFALTARVDWNALPGLLVGVSGYTGESGQGAMADGRAIGARVRLFDAHAQYDWRGLQLRGLLARGSLSDAALVNRQNSLTGTRSVGGDQGGFYVQAAFDLATLRPVGSASLTPFVRYERLDTQDSVPAGFAEDPALDRNVLTVGAGLKPIPNVVLKADYQRVRNQARTGVSQVNLGVGYLF